MFAYSANIFFACFQIFSACLYVFIKSEKINLKSYFCKPCHCLEKGTVENIKGLIRRFFQKGTDFDTITEEEIACVEDWINNRPMKILNYMTHKQKLQFFSFAIDF